MTIQHWAIFNQSPADNEAMSILKSGTHSLFPFSESEMLLLEGVGEGRGNDLGEMRQGMGVNG